MGKATATLAVNEFTMSGDDYVALIVGSAIANDGGVGVTEEAEFEFDGKLLYGNNVYVGRAAVRNDPLSFAEVKHSNLKVSAETIDLVGAVVIAENCVEACPK